MNEGRKNGAPGGVGPELEELRRIRLVGFLRELVRQQGTMATARLLEIDYKTLKRSLDAGRVTPHVADALEGLTEDGDDGETGPDRQLVAGLPVPEGPGALRPVAEVVGEDHDDRLDDGSDDGDDGADDAIEEPPAEGRAEPESANAAPAKPVAPPVAGLGAPRQSKPLRRRYPELVSGEPAEDDAAVYGDAWPLVQQWRRLWDGHPRRGRGRSWLTTRERLLELELALLEEHGLTLPPETEPLRGFARRGQTRWRETALARTRRALRRRRMLHWLLRKITLGRWPS